jgi:hypothetical protein
MWLPFETAPKIEGQRILAWCNPAESESGIVEMQYNGKHWIQVIDHPWPNACMCPAYWTHTIAPPTREE